MCRYDHIIYNMDFLMSAVKYLYMSDNLNLENLQLKEAVVKLRVV